MDNAVTCLRDIALTFPALPTPLIERPYLLETIDGIFDSGCDVVVIEGEEQIGKTVLMAQYAIRHPERSFTLFIRPLNDMAFDPRQIRYDLCNQMTWYLRATTLPDEASASLADLRNLILVLQRRRGRRDPPYFWIVDGLGDIPSGSAGIRDLIIKYLPIGLDGFRVLLSGSASALGFDAKSKMRWRSFPVSPFGLHETEQFFSDVANCKDSLQAIRTTCRGNPGKLGSVRRLIRSGVDVQNVLDLLPERASEIFESEWQPVMSMGKEHEFALACLCFLQSSQTLSTLAAITGLNRGEDLVELRHLAFLEVDEGQVVRFISDAFRKFCASKLRHLEQRVWRAATAYLSYRSDTREALSMLPVYLEKTGDLGGMASYLSLDRLARSVRESKSITASLKFLAHVSSVFQRGGVAEQTIRLGVMRTSLAGLLNGGPEDYRLEAALEVNREALAVSIANSATLDEQRLHLLILIAKHRHRKKREEDSAISNQIALLIKAIDFATLKDDTALTISANLLPILPHEAGEVLRSHVRGSNDPNALDVAISRLALSALTSGEDERSGLELMRQVDKLASSTAMKEISAVAALALATDSPEDVLQQLATLGSTGEKVFSGRMWLMERSQVPGAIKVALEVLKEVLADTRYTPSATTFRDLARPLLYAERCEGAQRLYSMLEGQCEITRRTGPIVDHYRLKFMLYRARTRLGFVTDSLSLLGEAFEIVDLADSASKAACLAWLLRELDAVEAGESDGLHDYASRELERAIEQVLQETAEHNEAVSPAIRALVIPRFEQALRIAGRLNTQERRDSAFISLAQDLSRDDAGAQMFSARLEQFSSLISMVKGYEGRLAAVSIAARWVASADVPESLRSLAVRQADQWISSLPDPEDRCLMASRLLSNRTLVEVMNDSVEERYKRIEAEWESIEDEWLRIHAGYASTNHLARNYLEKASKFFERVEEYGRERIALVTGAGTFRLLLLLCGRVYAGLTKQNLVTSEDLNRILAISEWLPGSIERARVLLRVAGYVSRYNVEQARQIVASHVRPVVQQSTGMRAASSEMRALVIEAAPMLWLAHQASALDIVSRFDEGAQQESFSSILDYVLMRRLPGEPWSEHTRQNNHALTEESLTEALQLLDKVKRDSLLARHIGTIAKSLKGKKGAWINRNQRVHFLQRLIDVVKDKLPDPEGIAHEGFLVLIDAEILSVSGGNHAEWREIERRTSLLPNLSDACYVAAMCVRLCSVRVIKQEFFNRAAAALRRLPTETDKLLRAGALLENCLADFPRETREIVGEVMKSSQANGAGQVERNRDIIVEMAHRVDEEWAASLVSVIDDDPVRIALKVRGEERLKLLGVQRRLVSEKCEIEDDIDFDVLADACWRELGVLNVSRVVTRTYADCIKLMEDVSDKPLADCYPVFAFGLEACATRYATTPQASDYLRPIFEHLVCAAELVRKVAASQIGDELTIEELQRTEADAGGEIDLVVKPGCRDDAIKTIEAWLRSVQPEELTIVDLYFRPEDQDALLLVQQIVPSCHVRVLTAAQNHAAMPVGVSFEQAYIRTWREHISPAQPPDALICIAGASGEEALAIHDRWWIAGERGLDIGTSWNSLGMSKTSVIKSVGKRESTKRMAEVEPYFQGRARSSGGQRIRCVMFTLS